MFSVDVDGESHFVEEDDTRVEVRFPDSDEYEEDEQPTGVTFANSAGVSVDPRDGGEVTVSISVGDPRGALTMTVRKVPDHPDSEYAGRLLLHVPHADMSMPHVALKELHPGTFLIGE